MAKQTVQKKTTMEEALQIAKDKSICRLFDVYVILRWPYLMDGDTIFLTMSADLTASKRKFKVRHEDKWYNVKSADYAVVELVLK